MAFLDDVYAIAEPERVRPIYDLLAAALGEVASIQLHAGKTRTWNRAGTPPPNMADLGDQVWDPSGVMVLGTSVGSDAFVERHVAKRLAEERKL